MSSNGGRMELFTNIFVEYFNVGITDINGKMQNDQRNKDGQR